MEIRYPRIGICGLSCRLCPAYHRETKSKCDGCKSEYRISARCPFITCAIKKKGIEFCWQCEENESCERWKNHREFSKERDTFVCYQKLEDNLSFIQEKGIIEFENIQKIRENLLKDMLQDFNEGRSKNYYSVAATIMDIDELRNAIKEAKLRSKGLEIKEKSKILHSLLDRIAEDKTYLLKLRKR